MLKSFPMKSTGLLKVLNFNLIVLSKISATGQTMGYQGLGRPWVSFANHSQQRAGLLIRVIWITIKLYLLFLPCKAPHVQIYYCSDIFRLIYNHIFM